MQRMSQLQEKAKRAAGHTRSLDQPHLDDWRIGRKGAYIPELQAWMSNLSPNADYFG